MAQSADLMALTELLADSFHARDGIRSWAYPILRLGIYEDLRNRLATSSDRYVCLVAVTMNSTDSQAPRDRSSGREMLVGTIEMGLRSRGIIPSSISPSFWIESSRTCQFPYLSNLAVHSEFRRLGVAQTLLNRCESIALQWGFSQLYLHVLENNDQARRLYSKAGYHLHQTDWNWSSVLFGQPRQLFLRKRLK